MSKMNELSHTLALEQIKELNKRIKELEDAIERAAVELEDGHCHPHFVNGEQNPEDAWDTVCVYNAHKILGEVTWMKK